MAKKVKCSQCNLRDATHRGLCSGCYGRNWREQRKIERAAEVAVAPRQLTSDVTEAELVIDGEIVHEQPTIPEQHLVALNPAEMQAERDKLRAHLEQKLTIIERDILEANAALSEARRNGWATGALTSARNRLVDDETYYNKILAAVEAGYTIIPEFPLEVFAVRSQGEKRETQTHWDYDLPENTHQGRAAEPDCAPAGIGEYRNPGPQVYSSFVRTQKDSNQRDRDIYRVTRTGRPVGPITFPSMTARSPVMRATAEAMKEKVFDQIGVCLPVQKAAKGRVIRPQPRRRQMNAAVGDPLIVGQVVRKSEGGRQRCVSFIIAWHLDLNQL